MPSCSERCSCAASGGIALLVRCDCCEWTQTDGKKEEEKGRAVEWGAARGGGRLSKVSGDNCSTIAGIWGWQIGLAHNVHSFIWIPTMYIYKVLWLLIKVGSARQCMAPDCVRLPGWLARHTVSDVPSASTPHACMLPFREIQQMHRLLQLIFYTKLN